MKYEEAISILENNPSEEDINRVAREWTKENGFKTIRNAAGREIMAFAGHHYTDEVPTQYSFKQHAWTKITDAVGEESRYITVVRILAEDEAVAVKALTDGGYKILKTKHEEKELPKGGKESLLHIVLDGAHADEVRVAYWNTDWFAGVTNASKGSNFYQNADDYKVTDSRILEKDLESLRNIINTELKNSGFDESYIVEPIHNGYLISEKENKKNAIAIGFNSMGGIVSQLLHVDNTFYMNRPGLEKVIRKIVERMGDARVVDSAYNSDRGVSDIDVLGFVMDYAEKHKKLFRVRSVLGGKGRPYDKLIISDKESNNTITVNVPTATGIVEVSFENKGARSSTTKNESSLYELYQGLVTTFQGKRAWVLHWNMMENGTYWYGENGLVTDDSGAPVTYSEPYKVSPILWGIDITEGDNTSTIYARTKEDLLRHVKQHGYEKRVADDFTDAPVDALPESEVMSIIRKNIPDTAQIHAKRIGTNNYSVSMKLDGEIVALFSIRWLIAAKLYTFVSGAAIDAVPWAKDTANRITEELNMLLIPDVPKISDSGVPPVKRMTK